MLASKLPPPSTSRRHSISQRHHAPPANFSVVPTEILHDFAQYLTRLDIKAFSLVSRSCFDFARHLIFTRVTLDLTSHEVPLLDVLAREADIVSRNPRTGISGLGACIRHMVIAFDGRASAESSRAVENFHSLLILLRRGVPALRVVEWDCCGGIIPSMALEAVASHPTVQELHLRHLALEERLPVTESYCSTSSCGITSFSLSTTHGSCLSSGMVSFLRQISGSLEKLSWTGNGSSDAIEDEEVPVFRQLRCLHVEGVNSKSGSLVPHLVGGAVSTLRTLSVDAGVENLPKYLASIGSIPPLEHVHICKPGDLGTVMEFVAQNPHIEGFTSESAMDEEFIDTTLLPTLATFSHLQTLNLIYASPGIPVSALEVIGSIHSLRNLWLSAGSQTGWDCEWVINHALIRQSLRGLIHLERLAFSQDTYITRVHPLAPLFRGGAGYYYLNKALPYDRSYRDLLTKEELEPLEVEADWKAARVIQDRLLSLAWERWHRESMMKIVEEYGRCFEGLRWFYVGQLVSARDWDQPGKGLGLVSDTKVNSREVLRRIWRPI